MVRSILGNNKKRHKCRLEQIKFILKDNKFDQFVFKVDLYIVSFAFELVKSDGEAK